MSKLKVSIAFLLLHATSLAASAPQTSSPLPGYRFDVLLSPPGIHTEAFGISEAGVITGSSRHPGGERTATLWTASGSRRLGLFGSTITMAMDLDSTGMAVGPAVQGPLGFRTFRWQAGAHEILTLQGTDQTTFGAVSEAGVIVGSAIVNGAYRATRWGSLIEGQLIPLPGNNPSLAFGVNDAGVIVGLWYTPTGQERGFIHTNGMTSFVDPLAGHEHTNLYDVNNFGVAVGHSTEVVAAGQGDTNAILVSNGTTHVIPNPSAAYEHVALKINDHGQVLGRTGSEPFLYQDGASWLLRDFPGVPQWTLAFANDINERGQIVGRIYGGVVAQGFVLTPCLGNLNRDPVIDIEDFDLFYRAYRSRNELADMDGNGVIDLTDEQLFLQAWTNGC